MFKEGDYVLVEVNGVGVPAVVVWDNNGPSVEVDLDILGLNSVERQHVKPDLSHKVWAVGDTVPNIDEAKTLKVDTAFVDSSTDIAQITDRNEISFVGSDLSFDWDSFSVTDYFPWTIVWVPNE